ncbi:MAG: helix-turn-helix domain-containing protein [Rhodocyclaceae bacterium]
MTKPKRPRPTGPSSRSATDIRLALGMNQKHFWGALGVTQSGGSRYESGRSIPRPVRMLLDLATAPEEDALERFKALREAFGPAARAERTPPRKLARDEPVHSETGWHVIESVRPITFRIERNALILRSDAPMLLNGKRMGTPPVLA